MNYDIEADWHLLNTCNYRCSYCFLPTHQLSEKIPAFAAPNVWRNAFDATGLTWLLHLTGGEPSALPSFVDLCETLSERHFLSLNSNLSQASIIQFADRINPARISFINAGFHMEERVRRSGASPFIRHASLLREKGFRVIVSLVATPQVLNDYDQAITLLKPAGLFPVPKLLRGVFEGRNYPEAYTPRQRALFQLKADEARAAYAPLLQQMNEAPSIDMFSDDKYLLGEPRFDGKMCSAGSRFVRLVANGNVFRCSEATALGNILQDSMKLRRPQPCDTKYCFYFCAKYSSGAVHDVKSDRSHITKWRHVVEGIRKYGQGVSQP